MIDSKQTMILEMLADAIYNKAVERAEPTGIKSEDVLVHHVQKVIDDLLEEPDNAKLLKNLEDYEEASAIGRASIASIEIPQHLRRTED